VLELLNNIVRRRGEECSATIDLFSLDLIRGDAVFIKSGAAPSYVKRDSSIFRVRSETAPIGLMNHVDAERMRVEVRPGDYIILLSDGVSSSPEDAPWLLELLAEPPRRSLKEYAEYLLAEAVKRSSTGDDMTIMIAKIDET
jgi:stage II sporulation protein E